MRRRPYAVCRHLAFGLLLLRGPASADAQVTTTDRRGRPPELRYVANAGVLVTVGGRRFLIDAPIRDGIAPYATSPARERDRLESAQPPYDGVDADPDHPLARGPLQPGGRCGAPRAQPARRLRVLARGRGTAPCRGPGSGRRSPSRRAAVPGRVGGGPGRRRAGACPAHPAQPHAAPARAARRVPHRRLRGPCCTSATPTRPSTTSRLLRGLPGVDLALLPFWYVLDPASRRFVAEAIRTTANRRPAPAAGRCRSRGGGAAGGERARGPAARAGVAGEAGPVRFAQPDSAAWSIAFV